MQKNEIAGFFEQLYLRNGMVNIFYLLHGITQQHKEWTDVAIKLLKE